MSEAADKGERAGLDAKLSEPFVKGASESIYKRAFEPIFLCFNGDLLIGLSAVVSLTYTANLEVDWAVVTLVGLIFLLPAVIRILVRDVARELDKKDGLVESLYAANAIFILALPFVTYLATGLSEFHHDSTPSFCRPWVGCFHQVHWEYWCFLVAGLSQSLSAFLVLNLLRHRAPLLHGLSTTRRILLLTVLCAGLACAASHSVSIAPLEAVQKLEEESLWTERLGNIARWAMICMAVWVVVFGSLAAEFIRAFRRKAA